MLERLAMLTLIPYVLGGILTIVAVVAWAFVFWSVLRDNKHRERRRSSVRQIGNN